MRTSATSAASSDVRRQRDFLGRRTFLIACWIAVTASTLLLATHTPGQEQPTVPTWVGLTALVGYLGGLGVLIGAPSTWYATKWGWFWIATNPLGMLAFLVLAGPFPRLPTPRQPHRRLGGVYGLIVSLLLSTLTHGTLTPFS